MEDELPSDFDTIVIGTGMPECILAAAHARIGKQVLHIDRNEYYGGIWTTFNLDGFEKWMEQVKRFSDYCNLDASEDFSAFLKEGETALPCSYNSKVFENCRSHVFMEENKDSESSTQKNVEHKSLASEETTPDDCSASKLETSESENSKDQKSETPVEVEASSNSSWSMSKIRSLYRKFNLDLSPKLLFSRGELVDLLISSNIARYADFKSVSRVLTYLNGKLEQVPCSRSDVFSTKNVTIVEKRMLMKLLTSCLNFEEHPDEYKAFENKPFVDFLKSQKLTPNVLHYVLHAIAMVSTSATTLEGLKATQRFLNSLGRYGNTPFLWPLYGSGELPQCFCRLCAVFGGVYYLKRELNAVIVDSENKCTGIISNGKRLNCRWLVMDANFAPTSFLPDNYGERGISRAIILSDKSMFPADKEQLTFLRLPPGDGLKSAVWVVELGSGSMACPSDLYVVHFTSEKILDAETDLQAAVNMIFNAKGETEESTDCKAACKPQILWSVYFNQADNSFCDLSSRAPSNVFLTSDPGAGIDFDNTVIQAKELFRRAFPGEEFLPRAPDPEEIIIEGGEESNPDFSQEVASHTEADVDDKIINEAGAQEETPESGIKIVVEEDPNSEMAGASKVCAEDNHKDVPKEE